MCLLKQREQRDFHCNSTRPNVLQIHQWGKILRALSQTAYDFYLEQKCMCTIFTPSRGKQINVLSFKQFRLYSFHKLIKKMLNYESCRDRALIGIRSLVWKAILILNLIKLNQNMVIEHMQEWLLKSNSFFEDHWLKSETKPFSLNVRREALPYNFSKSIQRRFRHKKAILRINCLKVSC